MPSYFADLLEERIADLVSARKWTELGRMQKALAATGPDAIVAQLSYILARARQEGLVTRLPGSPAGSARDYFREAARLNPAGYYGIMAGSRLGELPPQAAPRGEISDSSGPSGLAGPAGPASLQPLQPSRAARLTCSPKTEGGRI